MILGSQPRERHAPTGAFTLFEVMISMLVLSIAVLATLALLPIGLKAQQMARAQLYAATMAESLIENFHSPVISMRGHGALAPDLDFNYSAAPDAPPVPTWAARLRNANVDTSAYQFDLERYVSGWITGVMPVPTDIARRLDSDGDEIQRHLDEGGQLYYVDPSFVRGLTVSANLDKAVVLHPAPEVHKLVFAVRGYAQQNALLSHPAEMWPWYETYPFPPAWVALRAHGFEYRSGPVSKMKRIDPRTGAVTWGPPVSDQDMLGRPCTAWGGAPNEWSSGTIWGDGGHAGWSPVVFDAAPMNPQQIRPPVIRSGPTDQTIYPIDPLDAPAPLWWRPWESSSVGWYQGRNWRYFHEHYGSSTPWSGAGDASWLAFQKLSGFNDAHRALTWGGYAILPEAEHYETCGWLPVMAMLTNDDNPRYDHYWYDILETAPPDPYHFRGGTAVGGENDVGTGVFPPWPTAAPVRWTGRTAGTDPGANTTGALWGQYDYRVATGAPKAIPLPPTYEMRASYRDKALELWNAVAADITAYDATLIRKGSPGDGYAPDVTNTQVDCDTYEYSGAELVKFPLIDPTTLPAGQAPPHPAQVLALSYLAHAAMLVTGWDVPIEGRNLMARVDWESLAWVYKNPLPPSPSTPEFLRKDVKILAADAAQGSTSVEIANDNPAVSELALYPGDEICFEEDYRQWFRATEPNPGQQPQRPCAKYLVTRFARIARGSAATATISLDPPLAHDYQARACVDPIGNPFMNPPIPPDAGHPQQIIRVCSEYDRAFARTVHEMCMRWAACYSSENAYDWGAPRMMNHQTMVDKPLAIFDLFHDASLGPSSPHAAVDPHDLPTSTQLSPNEPFYRWLLPPNPAPRSWFKSSFTPATGPVCAISHQGPGRNNQGSWESLTYNPQLAPASTPGATTTSQWNWTSDADRYWLNRPFSPCHRGRQLVYWSVDWKSYADAEIAPSATMDWAKAARCIRTQSKNGTTEGDGANIDLVYPMFIKGAGNDAWNGGRIDSQLAGNPENSLVWIDATRKKRWIDDKTDLTPAFAAYTRTSEDVVLGHWGADRNNNRKLDIGPIPRTARMRALTVSRFNVYDPVLRLHNSD